LNSSIIELFLYKKIKLFDPRILARITIHHHILNLYDNDRHTTRCMTQLWCLISKEVDDLYSAKVLRESGCMDEDILRNVDSW